MSQNEDKDGKKWEKGNDENNNVKKEEKKESDQLRSQTTTASKPCASAINSPLTQNNQKDARNFIAGNNNNKVKPVNKQEASYQLSSQQMATPMPCASIIKSDSPFTQNNSGYFIAGNNLNKKNVKHPFVKKHEKQASAQSKNQATAASLPFFSTIISDSPVTQNNEKDDRNYTGNSVNNENFKSVNKEEEFFQLRTRETVAKTKSDSLMTQNNEKDARNFIAGNNVNNNVKRPLVKKEEKQASDQLNSQIINVSKPLVSTIISDSPVTQNKERHDRNFIDGNNVNNHNFTSELVQKEEKLGYAQVLMLMIRDQGISIREGKNANNNVKRPFVKKQEKKASDQLRSQPTVVLKPCGSTIKKDLLKPQNKEHNGTKCDVKSAKKKEASGQLRSQPTVVLKPCGSTIKKDLLKPQNKGKKCNAKSAKKKEEFIYVRTRKKRPFVSKAKKMPQNAKTKEKEIIDYQKGKIKNIRELAKKEKNDAKVIYTLMNKDSRYRSKRYRKRKNRRRRYRRLKNRRRKTKFKYFKRKFKGRKISRRKKVRNDVNRRLVRKVNRQAKKNINVKRGLVRKEEGQAYAQVIKMLGNGRLEAMCFDGQKRLCHIRGKLRKKVWINTSDIILIGLRDFQDEKADVILKYSADEARTLKSRGEIPENVNITDTSQFGQDAGGDDIFFDEQFSDDDENTNIDQTLSLYMPTVYLENNF